MSWEAWLLVVAFVLWFGAASIFTLGLLTMWVLEIWRARRRRRRRPGYLIVNRDFGNSPASGIRMVKSIGDRPVGGGPCGE